VLGDECRTALKLLGPRPRSSAAVSGRSSVRSTAGFERSSTARISRSVLDANALAEYTLGSDPAVNPASVIANLKSARPDRLDEM
jgi:hypothetical protein